MPSDPLFDLTADPGEMTNVVAANGRIVGALLATLETSIAAGRSTGGEKYENDIPVPLRVVPPTATKRK